MIDRALEVLREKLAIYDAHKKNPKEPLEFWEGYSEAVELYNQTLPHCSTIFPDRLFREKAPHEDPASFEYGKKIYRPVTMPYWQRGLNTLYKIWNPQNWTWKISQGTEAINEDETPVKYFESDYPIYNSIDQYFRQVVTPMTVTDANALLCVMPKYIPTELERAVPIVRLFNVPDVWEYTYDEALLHSDEKSKVAYGNGYEWSGMVFFYFDKEAIYKIVQVGKKIDMKFEAELYYQHNLGYLPCQQLKGVPVYKQQTAYWMSYFYPAVPLLDQALIDFNTLQKSKFAHAFLQRWEYIDECGYQSPSDGACDRGIIHGKDGDYNCPQCGGSGKHNNLNPLSVYQVKVPDRIDPNVGQMSIPPAGYIDLDHSILNFLRSEYKTEIIDAFQVINIDVADSTASGDETATGKAIDREEQHSFLVEFAQSQFGLMEFSINAMGEMRYMNEWEPVQITPPMSFEIRKPKEITEELAQAPAIARRELLRQYAQTRLGSSGDALDLINVLLEMDSLSGVDEKTILAEVTAGIIPKWRYVIHRFGHELLDAALTENADFMALDAQQKKAKIKELAQVMAAESNPPTGLNSILNVGT
jgi:hypothetical protein